MPKQLILQAAIELPDDIFEQGTVIAAAKEPWHAALKTWQEQSVPVTCSHRIEQVKAPRAKRSDAGKQRKSRANGTATAAAEPDAPAP